MIGNAPLSGIRVLELGSSVAGPAAGRLLGDLGAEVFKIEPPEGDQLRTWGELAPDGTSWWFKSHNRNKKLLSFDLRDAGDVALVKKIALACDVVLENFRPGWLEKRGLGPKSLRAEKPELIYVSISGFGQDGPYASRPGYGNIAESMGGLRYISGDPEGPPMRLGISIGDELAGLHAVVGVLAALVARDRDGRGDAVDVSLIESCFALLEATLPEYAHAGKIARRMGNRYLRAAPSGVYPTRDGHWLAIGGNSQGIFRRLTATMGKPELAADPKFATNQTRMLNVVELDEHIERWTRTLDHAEAMEQLGAAEVPAGPAMSIADIVADPHFQARGAIASIEDDDGTPVATYGPMPRFAGHPSRMGRAAGKIGRDREAVLRELGLMQGSEVSNPHVSAVPSKNRVTLVDVTARDGFQDEPSFVATADKLGVAEALHAAGVGHIEITSFVHPRWVPQLADADELVPRLAHGPRYSVLTMNARGLERAIAAFAAGGFRPGSWDAIFVTSASPRHAMANNNRTIDETLANFDEVAALAKRESIALRGGLACAFVSPWPDEERIETGRVVEIVQRFVTGGVNGVTIADTVGFADPRTVAKTVAAVRDATGIALSLHLHDAHGYALANVYAGLEGGVRSFEGALAGLGGCPWAPGAPGNLDLEKLNRFLTDCGCDTGVDPDKLATARERVRAALARATPIAREVETADR